jgi:hypothetical protein
MTFILETVGECHTLWSCARAEHAGIRSTIFPLDRDAHRPFGRFLMQRKQLLGIAARVQQPHPFGGGMSRAHGMTRAIGWTAGLGLFTLGYATVVGTTWSRYDHVPPVSPDERDPLLDRFMPEYEVTERHHARVTAPTAITLAAAADTDLQQSRIVRAIFKAREMVLGANPDAATRPKGLLAQTTSLGWRCYAKRPDAKSSSAP